ncbi:MAG: coproporphyrinogen dehydrogenase HemZ [Eubacteriales bacterium]|nr:coproporphyrinogen dehydrogenase HemZ [Eubacteriales bacterium]
MILLLQDRQEYNNDLRAMIMAFYPGVKIVEDATVSESFELTVRIWYEESHTILTVCGQGDTCDKPEDLKEVEELPFYKDVLLISTCGYRARINLNYRDKAIFRNVLKMAAYRLLGQLNDRRLPWGDMTGVRPTKIALKHFAEGMTFDAIQDYYKQVYAVSDKKAELATTVAKKERSLVHAIDIENSYCLYVGIPFCPSRCLYCSFTSYPIARYQMIAENYIDTLCKELAYLADTYRNKELVSIYIGGGTPTSISHELLDKLLTAIETEFGLQDPTRKACLKEFTVEAGRPDSITDLKLQVMKKHGVSRISINPQTMNDETLRTIGRAHTSSQTKDAFVLARACGFDNINMDLIAGLPGENLDSMRNTLNQIKKLQPESLTVHSLAIKRAANLKQELGRYEESMNQDMDAMLELVSEVAKELSMEPYYLYRQKNIGGNLENVGYAKAGFECLYNVLIMEELTDIIAAGAGASTKLVFHEDNRVERVENCKSVDDYINRFEEMLDRKRRMF